MEAISAANGGWRDAGSKAGKYYAHEAEVIIAQGIASIEAPKWSARNTPTEAPECKNCLYRATWRILQFDRPGSVRRLSGISTVLNQTRA